MCLAGIVLALSRGTWVIIIKCFLSVHLHVSTGLCQLSASLWNYSCKFSSSYSRLDSFKTALGHFTCQWAFSLEQIVRCTLVVHLTLVNCSVCIDKAFDVPYNMLIDFFFFYFCSFIYNSFQILCTRMGFAVDRNVQFKVDGWCFSNFRTKTLFSTKIIFSNTTISHSHETRSHFLPVLHINGVWVNVLKNILCYEQHTHSHDCKLPE